MKKIQLILAMTAIIFTASCKKAEIPTWSGDDRIRFRTNVVNDTLQGYSFLGVGSDTTQYVMYIEVNVEGYVRNFPRPITFRQVATGDDDAVPGTHYVAFDDALVRDQYVIQADSATARIPIILFRHASLLNEEKTLRIELVQNQHFQLTTDSIRQFRRIVFAEKYAKADAWDVTGTAAVNPYFGPYGLEKHRFMSSETNMAFDNAWFDEYFAASGTWRAPRNAGYMTYLRQLLQNKLNERNAAAIADGGEELKEADGTVVRFI